MTTRTLVLPHTFSAIGMKHMVHAYLHIVQNIAAKDIGAFLESLGGLDDVSRLKIVNLEGNRVGSKNESMVPIDTLLTASSGSLTALNLGR